MFVTSCNKASGNFGKRTPFQSVVNKTVYFALLKKMNSAMIITKLSGEVRTLVRTMTATTFK
jgi:hypothetical protein